MYCSQLIAVTQIYQSEQNQITRKPYIKLTGDIIIVNVKDYQNQAK